MFSISAVFARSVACLVLLASILEAAPKIIAHRGASADAPENTIAAFKLAWEQGADGIEGDFHLSSDGEIVCFHDEDTKNITGQKLVIAETPYQKLSQLDVGSWKGDQFANERIPLLKEVLGIIPDDKYFFLEVKCGPEIVPHLKTQLTNANKERTIIICFDHNVIKACRNQIPDFHAHYLSKLDEIDKANEQQDLFKLLNDIDANGVQFKCTAPVNAAFISKLRTRKMQTASWTVDHPFLASALAGMRVDFITTNKPAMIRKGLPWQAAE